MKSPHTGLPQGPILGPTLSLLYINDLPDDIICNIVIYAYDTTLYIRMIRHLHLICGNNQSWLLNFDLQETVDNRRKCPVDFNAEKAELVLFDRSNKTGATDVKIDGSILEKKSSFKMLGCLSLLIRLGLLHYLYC